MLHYFGFSHFREGQWEAIHAVLQGKDVAVFWSTGSGKSMTYILPALYGYFQHQQQQQQQQGQESPKPTTTATTPICLVVSPLISLMQDQVHKLNHLGRTGEAGGDKPLATFLGSAQTDATMESRALQGEFPLVYCTPEKLQSPYFVEELSRLPLCLIAIDEAHCVR